jgi:hypothetical protein
LLVSLSNAHDDLCERPTEGDPPNAAEGSVVPGRIEVVHVVPDEENGESGETEEVVEEGVDKCWKGGR